MTSTLESNLSPLDFQRSMKKVARKSSIPLEDTAINYYLGPASYLFYKIAKEIGVVQSDDDVTIIGAGAGSAHANFNRINPENWKRLTGDVDVHQVDVSIEDFQFILEGVSEELRDLMKKVYGTSIFNGQDILVKRVEEGLMSVPHAKTARILRGDLIIPSIGEIPKSKVYYEADRGAFSFLDKPLLLPVSHPYSDKDFLNLGEIKVPTMRDYLGLKIVGFLYTISNIDTRVRASRLKDLFDIWYLTTYLKIPVDGLSESVSNVLRFKVRPEVAEFLGETSKKIINNPTSYLQELADIIREDLNDGDKMSAEDVLKQHTSGLFPVVEYPTIEVVAHTLVKILRQTTLIK